MKRERPSDEELTKLSHEDFIVWFLDYNAAIINRYIMRRLIPNRYEPNDIKAYMAERMLDILQKRKAKNKAIKNPRIYFGKLIDFWCIEYQRMHGYCYSMPKRPRCVEAEQEISKYGFVYLDTPNDGGSDSNISAYGFSEQPQLSYIDKDLTADEQSFGLKGYNVRGGDPGESSKSWHNLMLMVLPEDRLVMECLFKMNMSVPETSKHLGIAVSTAYARRDRAMLTISGHLGSSVDLDQSNWKILDDINHLNTSSMDITELFNGLK